MQRNTLVTVVGALTLLAAALAANAASPFGRMVAIEQAVEVRAGDVTLPASDTGILLVTPCRGCKLLDLRASTATIWQVGTQPASLAELRTIAARHPDAALIFFYGTQSRVLNRARIELPRPKAR